MKLAGLLKEGLLLAYSLAVLQQFRFAANEAPVLIVKVASRVAEEVHCRLGEIVGYSIRFDDCYSLEKTRMKVGNMIFSHVVVHDGRNACS